MKHIVIEHSRNTFHNEIFSKYITFLNFLFQALQQLRTSEFKPYVIFVKPAVQEKRKTPPMSPACEDAAAPLVSFQESTSWFTDQEVCLPRVEGVRELVLWGLKGTNPIHEGFILTT